MQKVLSFARLLGLDPGLALHYIRYRVHAPRTSPVTVARVNGRVNFEFDLALDPEVRAMCSGVYEVWTLRALRAWLQPNDTFVDVGANIGFISAYAASVVGPGGQVHSFEPVPAYYVRLQEMASRNPGYALRVNNCALGEDEGTSSIAVTSLPNIGWNTMVSGFMSRETTREVIPVKMRRLDEYLQENGIEKVAMVKIDVEGFEMPVLRGLQRFLERTSVADRPVLLVEVAPKAYPLLHISILQLEEFLSAFGYATQTLDRPGRRVRVTDLTETTNILCVPAGR
jgi:FkbM family methyltransferase